MKDDQGVIDNGLSSTVKQYTCTSDIWQRIAITMINREDEESLKKI